LPLLQLQKYCFYPSGGGVNPDILARNIKEQVSCSAGHPLRHKGHWFPTSKWAHRSLAILRHWMKILSVSILALTVIGAATRVAQCAERPPLTPFVGETAAEFEARKNGKARPESTAGSSSVMLVADPSGHFFLTSTVDGIGVRMVVDTGASIVSLSQEDANRAGINLEPSKFTAKVSTANGVILAAPVMLKEIAIGDISVRNVAAVVMPKQALQVSLLGMSFLSRLSGYEVTGSKLTLRR
jgi:aspartyl protease family protein